MEENLQTITNAASETTGETIIRQTSSFISWIKNFLTWDNFFKVIIAVVVILVLWLIYKLLMRGINKVPQDKTTPQRTMIVSRIIKYGFYVIVAMYVLSLFGVKLSAIWGAAGIAGIAIGFAAQTSVSNLISGLFVITEGSLKVGDTIIIDEITGVVDAINLISVRVHTFDNQMVRIPNSTIINKNLTNNSFHGVRRLTINFDVSYSTDLEKALEIILKAPALCPTVLKDPEPAAWIDKFGENGVNIICAVWFCNPDFIETKNTLFIAVKKVLDDADIEIPFNQIDIKIKENDKKTLRKS